MDVKNTSENSLGNDLLKLFQEEFYIFFSKKLQCSKCCTRLLQRNLSSLQGKSYFFVVWTKK